MMELVYKIRSWESVIGSNKIRTQEYIILPGYSHISWEYCNKYCVDSPPEITEYDSYSNCINEIGGIIYGTSVFLNNIKVTLKPLWIIKDKLKILFKDKNIVNPHFFDLELKPHLDKFKLFTTTKKYEKKINKCNNFLLEELKFFEKRMAGDGFFRYKNFHLLEKEH